MSPAGFYCLCPADSCGFYVSQPGQRLDMVQVSDLISSPLSPSSLSQETFIQVTCHMEELLNRPTIVSIIAMKILYHMRAVSV